MDLILGLNASNIFFKMSNIILDTIDIPFGIFKISVLEVELVNFFLFLNVDSRNY